MPKARPIAHGSRLKKRSTKNDRSRAELGPAERIRRRSPERRLAFLAAAARASKHQRKRGQQILLGVVGGNGTGAHLQESGEQRSLRMAQEVKGLLRLHSRIRHGVRFRRVLITSYNLRLTDPPGNCLKVQVGLGPERPLSKSRIMPWRAHARYFMWRDKEPYEILTKDRGRRGSRHDEVSLQSNLDALAALAPAGFSAGLHIRFASPLIYVRTYDAAWTKIYDENAFALRDPLVFWGLGVKGHTRWSAIKLPDPFNILGQAQRFGLNFGAVISCGPITSRSIVGMAHAAREFTHDEIAEAVRIVHKLHAAAEPPTELTPAQIEALQLLADGDRHAAAAAKLGISESAFKARLQSARVRLGARTTAQALKKAREYQLL